MQNMKSAGFTPEGREVFLVTLRAASGLKAVVSNAGASLISFFLPDSTGEAQDLVLGPADPMARLAPGPMFGITLGRCAGRVRGAQYVYNGETVRLSPNKKGHHGHGGYRGFDKHVFDVLECTDERAVFSYRSPDGEEGYPGNLCLKVTYALQGRELLICYQAACDKDCLVSLSNHVYWNLAGEDSGELTGHTARLFSSRVARLNEEMLPDGTLLPVEGTPFDFTSEKPLVRKAPTGNGQFDLIGWYDHDFEIDSRDGQAARIRDARTGREMRVYTDRPGFHFYIYDFPAGEERGKHGQFYEGNCGFCVMPMYLPNSVNIPEWPNPILRAGEKYDSVTRFAFAW